MEHFVVICVYRIINVFKNNAFSSKTSSQILFDWRSIKIHLGQFQFNASLVPSSLRKLSSLNSSSARNSNSAGLRTQLATPTQLTAQAASSAHNPGSSCDLKPSSLSSQPQSGAQPQPELQCRCDTYECRCDSTGHGVCPALCYHGCNSKNNQMESN